MRITIVNQFFPPDEAPTGKLCKSLADFLATAGHEVTILASNGGYRIAGEDDAGTSDIRVIRAWTPRLGKASVLRRLTDYAFFYLVAALRAIFLRRQDLFICLTTPPFIVWVAYLHRLIHRRTKVVLWNMDCYPEVAERCGKLNPESFISRLTRWNNRAIFRGLDHLISLDPAMQELLISQYGPAKRELPATIIPNWEQADHYPPSMLELPPWEGVDRLGLADRFVVLYSGNLGVGHTFDAVLDAADQLRDRNDIIFLIVGNGAQRAVVEAAIRERTLSNVILHDYVDRKDLPAMLNSASCALITLRDWALGVMSPSKLHANLALGLPVVYVGPAGSNVDQAINEYDCGKRFTDDQGAALAAYLLQLRDDPALSQRLSANAREAFDAAYCDQRTLPQFTSVLNDLNPSA